MTITRTAFDTQLLPDTARHGQGFGPAASYTSAQLDEIAQNVNETKRPGYGRRLRTGSLGYVAGVTRCQVPAGYDVVGHPNRVLGDPGSMDPDITTLLTGEPVQVDPGVQDYCRAHGWVLDQHGRPLHPHHEQLLGDDRIGLPTGLGFGYWYGESAVTDAVVTAGNAVLLVPRMTDAGTIPALPGGYSVPADFGRSTEQWRSGDRPTTVAGLHTAAARKVLAETGLTVPRGCDMRIARAIRPVSLHTLHSWTATYTVHIDLGRETRPALPLVTGGTWVGIDDLSGEVLGRMWPDHRRALIACLPCVE